MSKPKLGAVVEVGVVEDVDKNGAITISYYTIKPGSEISYRLTALINSEITLPKK